MLGKDFTDIKVSRKEPLQKGHQSYVTEGKDGHRVL